MLRLTTLGAVDLRDSRGHSVRGLLMQPKRVALLAYLAVEGARAPVSRDRILALFWPESDEARARNALSQSLHHLRQALGPGVIESEGLHTIGVRHDRLWCDATAFADALDGGQCELALDMYRGDFCPALYVSGAPELEQWLDGQRRRLRDRAQDALLALARGAAERGDGPTASRAARRALAMQPDDEADVRTLLGVLERAGDVAGALQAYRELEQRLAHDLETRPAAETRQLIEGMRRRRDAAASGAPAPESVASAPASLGVAPSAIVQAAPAGRRRIVGFSAIALLAAVVLGAVVVWRGQRAGRMPVDDNAVATFPFAVSGDSALAYLRDGMVDLLDARLDGAGGIRTIDPHVIQAAVARGAGAATFDPRSGSQLSRRLGARLFILGEIVASHGRLHLGATLYDGARHISLAHADIVGDTTQLFASVDALAGQLLANRPQGPGTQLARAAALTTKSLDALRAYVDGERAYREGQYLAAVEAFERSTALDTAFALAWYRLAVAKEWAGGGALGAAAHAMAHLATLGPRERRLVFGYWLYLKADPNTERVYHDIVARYPDDVEAWSFLGETQFHWAVPQGRSFGESRDAFTRVLALDPGNPNALLHLARIAAAEGRRDDLDSLAKLYLAGHPIAERALEMRVLRAFALNDRGEQNQLLVELGGAADATLDLTARGVAAYVQDLDGAARLIPLLLAPARTVFYATRGRALDAELALAAGRWREAQRRLDAVAAADWDWALEVRAFAALTPFAPATAAELTALRDDLLRWRHPLGVPSGSTNFSVQNRRWVPAQRAYLLGLVSVRLGDTAAARGYARLLDRWDGTAGDSGLAGDFAHVVRAEIALRTGALREALAQAEQIHFAFSAPIMHHTLYAGAHERFLHAELLHAVGRDEEALRWYASFPEPSGYDITYLAPAYLRRAEIEVRLGRREQARAHYRRFLRLWEGCDPGVRPLVNLGTHALAQLGGGSEGTP